MQVKNISGLIRHSGVLFYIKIHLVPNIIVGRMNYMKNNLKLIFGGFAAGICNGLFGSGGGMVAVPVLEKSGLDTHKSHASAVAVVLPLTVVSIFRYASFVSVRPGVLLPVCIGGSIGAFVGAKFLKSVPSGVLRYAFAAFITASGIRMVIL